MLLVVICLGLFITDCSCIHKNAKANMKENNYVESDSSSFLNEAESKMLDKIFETIRKDFVFTDKKIGFIEISGERGKASYFDMQKKHLDDKNYPCDNGMLYIFNASQKEESGGYDAAIVYWSKFVIPIEKVIERLKRQH
jgi:hypothetical protein